MILCTLILPGGAEAEHEFSALPRKGEALRLELWPEMMGNEPGLFVVESIGWVVPAEGEARARVFLEWSTGE